MLLDDNTKNQTLTKRKIINAAIKLFALKDFASVSTREIATTAGVNLSLISYYFKTKDKLYSSIVETISTYGLEYLTPEIKAAAGLYKMKKEEKIELFRSLLHKYIDFIYSERVPDNFIILMLKEQTISNSKYGELYRAKSQVLYSNLRNILSSITDRRSDDPVLVLEVCALVGQILSFKLMRCISFEGLGRKEYTCEDITRIKKLLHGQINSTLIRLNIIR